MAEPAACDLLAAVVRLGSSAAPREGRRAACSISGAPCSAPPGGPAQQFIDVAALGLDDAAPSRLARAARAGPLLDASLGGAMTRDLAVAKTTGRCGRSDH